MSTDADRAIVAEATIRFTERGDGHVSVVLEFDPEVKMDPHEQDMATMPMAQVMALRAAEHVVEMAGGVEKVKGE